MQSNKQDVTHIQFLSGVYQVQILSFLSTILVSILKVKKPSLPICWRRIDRFISFLRYESEFAQYKMQTVTSRITVPISDNDNKLHLVRFHLCSESPIIMKLILNANILDCSNIPYKIKQINYAIKR